MVDLKDLLNAVKPKDDGKEGGLDDLIGGAIDMVTGGDKKDNKGGLDDLIGGAIDAVTGGSKKKVTEVTSAKDDKGGLDDLLGGLIASFTGKDTKTSKDSGSSDMIMKILKGTLTSAALTQVIKSFTSNLGKKPDVVDNLTSSLEKSDVDNTTIDTILTQIKEALAK